MTLILGWLVIVGADFPAILLFAISMVCDVVLLTVAMVTGVLH